MLVFTRSVFRCAELSGWIRWQSEESGDHVYILGACVIVLSVGLLTAWHPGLVFGREVWHEASWDADEQREVEKANISSTSA